MRANVKVAKISCETIIVLCYYTEVCDLAVRTCE